MFTIICPGCKAWGALRISVTIDKTYSLCPVPRQGSDKGTYIYTNVEKTRTSRTICTSCNDRVEGAVKPSEVVHAAP